MKTRLLTIALTIVCCCNLAIAQTETFYNKVVKNAPYIFEGKVITQVHFVKDKNGFDQPFTANKVQISRIYRGSGALKEGTINIITEGGLIESNGVVMKTLLPSHSDGNEFAGNGIYFCYSVTSNKMGSEYPSTGRIIHAKGNPTSITADNSISVKYLAIINLSSLEGLDRKFATRQEINEFLSKYDNIKIPKEDKEKAPSEKKTDEQPEVTPSKKKDVFSSLDAISKKNQIEYAQNERFYEKSIEILRSTLDITAKKTGNSCEEPFFSEMIEANAPNRALEIFNPSDFDVDLSGFSVRLFQNGQLTPLIIPLSGTIPAKGTFVIAHQAAKPEIKSKADMLDPQLNFDGNDAIVLEKTGGTQIDKIGEVGVNPGNSGWNIPPNGSTKEQTLRRKHPVDKGETNWNQAKNQWNVHPKDSVSNLKKHQNVCSSTSAANVELFFEFDNPQVTGTDTLFFEFDISIRASNDSTFLESCFLTIYYDVGAFGLGIISNNRLTLTHGSSFNKPTYEDATFFLANIGNTIQMTTVVDNTQPIYDRTLITTSPETLLHLKMEILNCNKFTGLGFTNIAANSVFNAYTLTPDDTLNYGDIDIPLYDVSTYTDTLDTFLCGQGISNFTTPVYPGTWYPGTANTDYLLTISGIGFDSVQGNVFFINANNPVSSNPLIKYVGLNSYDILNWTDSEIQIRMPSIIDSVEINFVKKQPVPGSGLFYIKTSSGDSLSNGTEIYMPYAISNAILPSPYKKVRLELAGDQDSGGYEFHLDTSIANNPAAKGATIAALHEWSCVTGVRWSLGADVTNQTQDSDGKSVIYFDDSLTTEGLTKVHPVACINSSNDTLVFIKEMDIAIRRNLTGGKTWMYDTTFVDLDAGKLDFYGVMQHELGHAHALRHVGQDDDLMWYATTAGPVNAINRGDVTGSIAGIDGGQDIMFRSATITLGSCPGVSVIVPLVSQNCVAPPPTYIQLLTKRLDHVSTFPNPLGNSLLNISYELHSSANVNFRIIDYTGKQIIAMNKGKLPLGRYEESIMTDKLTPGFYFLTVTIGEQLYTNKIIKL